MIRINLLPHRAEKRKERRQQFYVMVTLMIMLGAGIGYAGHMYVTGLIEQQERRNTLLRNDIAELDKEIAEIRSLRQEIEDLVNRMRVIESLQGNRAEVVHLLNELVHRMPEGVRLTSLRQTGTQVTLVGNAQSNARVSHLMRSLESSPVLAQAGLVEVRSAVVGGRRMSEFTLNISIVRPSNEEIDGVPQ